MSEVTAPQVLVKQPAESIVYSMEFANLLASGETLSVISSVAADPSGPTISGQTINGSAVNFRVAGGTDGVDYRIEVTVTTSAGNTREADGILQVRDS